MKTLITTLNSKYVHSNLALKYLYTAAEPYVSQLEMKEFTINNSKDYIYGELVRGGYDAVCFSCYIWNIDSILDLAEDLKKACPQVIIALGGPEVSYQSEEVIMKNSFIDYIMIGEGELIFSQLCRVFSGELDAKQVKGLTYREKGNIFVNVPMPLLSLSSIPFPYDFFPCEEDKVIYYESSRGCPFNCSYCISSLDKKMRALPLTRVKEDLSYFIHKRVKQVKFLDRTFNWDKERTMEIFKYLIGMDNGDTNFHFEICADLLDDRVLALLQKARKGLFQFEIGIQSTNEETLVAVNRTSDIQSVLKHVKKLVSLGNSHVHTDLIAGLPYEDFVRFRKSFNDVYYIGADHLQLGFLKLLKGTKILEEAETYNYQFKSKAPYEVISNQFISAEELIRLKQIEHVLDLYYNRGGFHNTLNGAIFRNDETPFDFYQSFSRFFYGKGYQHKSHKKEDLYRIFYAYFRDIQADETLLASLEKDLEETMNFDAVKKFKRKGWHII